MIDMYKKLVTYQIEHGLRYVNENVNSATSLQIAWISLIDKNLDNKK